MLIRLNRWNEIISRRRHSPPIGSAQVSGMRWFEEPSATTGRGAAMKIVHLTDIHLGPKGLVRFGADQHERLAAAIAGINANHPDAALCIVTGDLADRGDLTAYEDLRTALA